jgi:phytanoyl-CoA hydroxylase
MTFITPEMWDSYERDGFLRLGKVLSNEDLKALQDRIDAIMLGEADVDYDRLLMQLDSKDGAYENAGQQSLGHKGKTLAYRKIQNLEFDNLFMEFMSRPIFREISAHVYGEDTPVSLFRAMFMNKPANQGTLLPWHQDRWSNLDRDPLITIWTALDPATIENGCVEIVAESHTQGLLNSAHSSGFLTKEQAQAASEGPTQFLELEAGEAVLLHNWLLHRSDKNHSSQSRRAFSVCYMDGRTIDINGNETFTPVFNTELSATA